MTDQQENPFVSDLKQIYGAAIEAVDPFSLVQRHLSFQYPYLRVSSEINDIIYDLSEYSQIYVIGAGKATARMALALETMLREHITQGVIAVKYGFTERLNRIRMIEAGHPIPDKNGIQASLAIMEIAMLANSHSLVIGLFSGGGSALLPYPLEYTIYGQKHYLALKLKQQLTQALLESGATIHEMNCVRKHLSMIKGGRLAQAIYPATSLNLFVSDVIGNQLDIIASGPTVPDRSTYQEMAKITRFRMGPSKASSGIGEIIKNGIRGRIPETPKPGDPIFATVHNQIIGDNQICLQAALNKATTLGYISSIPLTEITGESTAAAQ